MILLQMSQVGQNRHFPYVLIVIFKGMTENVRWVLDTAGCLPEKLCSIFGYRFVKDEFQCCSYCHENMQVFEEI